MPLGTDGRRTRKELGMPVADHRAGFENRRLELRLHQHHHGSRYGDRRSRVQGYAERTVIGGALDRMNVRHLRHHQQSGQKKTHCRDPRPRTRPETASSADLRWKPCQPDTLA